MYGPASCFGRFTQCPCPGELGSETWLNDSWSYSGNAGVWGIMSADEELGYVYLPIESALDYYGGTHPGDNLFADSIVCLDARTGKRVWHFSRMTAVGITTSQPLRFSAMLRLTARRVIRLLLRHRSRDSPMSSIE